jgi:hypothetical protein
MHKMAIANAVMTKLKTMTNTGAAVATTLMLISMLNSTSKNA